MAPSIGGGCRKKITLGGNYKRLTASSLEPELDWQVSPVGNIFHFDPSLWPAPTLGSNSLSRYYEEQAGGYTSFTFTPWAPLHFMIGTRYNYYTWKDFGTKKTNTYKESQLQSPSYAISYDITPNLTTYVSYSGINLSQANMRTKEGKPLNPVTGSNKEVGIKYGDDDRNATLSLYQLKQRNMATVTYFDIDAFYNGETATCCFMNNSATQISEGIDLEVNGKLLERWQVSASYTYNRSKYEGKDAGGPEGKPLNTQVPSQIMKLWSSYQLSGNPYLERLKIGGGVKAQTKSYTEGESYSTANGTSVPFTFTQGFYADFSAFANYQFDKNWSAALNVNNIFDRHYYQTVGDTRGGNWYAEPRNVALTIFGQF